MNKRVKKFLLLLLGLNLLLNTQPPTLAQSFEEQMVLSALTLNIVRFTTWPAEAHIQDTIDLCIIGNNVTQESFVSIDHKAVGNKTLQFTNLSSLRNFENCHVLYIGELRQNVLLQVFTEIKKRPLLTISEGYEVAE